MMTGMTYATKGCADVQWCYHYYGCNPTSIMCANCCQGNKCNLDFNVTTQTTMVPTTVKPLTTTWLPQTTTRLQQTTTTTCKHFAFFYLCNAILVFVICIKRYDSDNFVWLCYMYVSDISVPSTCDISYTVTSLMMKTLNLLNFNLLSIMDRRSLCQ